MSLDSTKLQATDEALKRLAQGAAIMRRLPRTQKDRVLNSLAELLIEKTEAILKANEMDLKALSESATGAFRDRLTLNPARLILMAESLKQVAALSDPAGEIIGEQSLSNGLKLRKIRSPLGVLFMIFESRPNVITEAFSLAFKSGNAIILRGGRESRNSAEMLYSLITQALTANQVSSDVLWGLTDPDRSLVLHLLKQKQSIDVVVPRGGEALIRFVSEESRIPIIKNDRGLCHAYVDEEVNLDMAVEIVHNAKVSRPGVCNSLETVLVHQKQAQAFLPALYELMQNAQVGWYGCPKTLEILGSRPGVSPATDENFNTEYLDFKINCRVVESYEQAIEHIERFSSKHSEAILTQNERRARDFQERVDAAAVYWNASTRFTDGFEFGLGGELGISTQKLHVRGPVGLRELTSARWVIDGAGQIRT